MGQTLRKLTTVMELDIHQMVDGIEVIKKVTRQATVTTKESTEAIEAAFAKVGRVVKVTENKTLTATAAITKQKRAVDQAQRVYDGYATTVEQANKMTGKTALEQAILTKQFQLGAGATDKQRKGMADLVRQEYALMDVTKKTTGVFKLQKGASQQLGYQMQDMAVQAQMGISPFTIIGQQGSQLAGVLGPHGALFGAVIAIGAAIGGVMYKAITGTSDAVEDFTVNVSELAGQLEDVADLTSNQLKIAYFEASKSLNSLSKEQGEAGKSIALHNKELDANTREQERNSGTSSRAKARLRQSVKARLAVSLALGIEQANLDKLNKEYKLQVDLLEELARKRSGLALSDQREAVTDLIADLKEEVLTYGASDKALARLDAERNKATKSQLTEIALLYDKKIALEEAAEEEKASAKEKAKATETGIKHIKKLGEEISLIGLSSKEKVKHVAMSKAVNTEYYNEILALETLKESKLADVKADKDRLKLISTLTDTGKLDKLDKQYKKERDLLAGHQAELIQLEENYSTERTKISGTTWEKWAVSAKENLGSFDSNVMLSLDRFASGFGDVFASSVLDSENLGDAVTGIFKGGVASMLSFFGEWAAQKAIMWALDQTLDSSANTAKATTMTTDASALSVQAGLAAFASTAAIPIIGPALAPAAAGAAVAATAPMAATISTLAFAGALDKGGLVRPGAAAIVSELGDELVGGTMVYNGSPNSLKVTGREETARGRSSGGNTFNINSNGNASAESIARAALRLLKKGGKDIDTAVFDSMSRGKTNRGKRFA